MFCLQTSELGTCHRRDSPVTEENICYGNNNFKPPTASLSTYSDFILLRKESTTFFKVLMFSNAEQTPMKPSGQTV